MKQEVKKQAPAPAAKPKAAAASAAAPAKATVGSTTKQDARIGVFICHCGTNIAGSMDIPAVQEYAKTIPNVAYVDNYKYMCSMPGQAVINKAIKDNNLTGVVVAACSPRLHEPTFRTATKEGGLNPFRFEMANIREQNSWVHMHDHEGSTDKAKDAIRIAVAKACTPPGPLPEDRAGREGGNGRRCRCCRYAGSPRPCSSRDQDLPHRSPIPVSADACPSSTRPSRPSTVRSVS